MMESVGKCVCGATEDVALRMERENGAEAWWVECEKCGRRTEKYGTPDEAARAWNARRGV